MNESDEVNGRERSQLQTEPVGGESIANQLILAGWEAMCCRQIDGVDIAVVDPHKHRVQAINPERRRKPLFPVTCP